MRKGAAGMPVEFLVIIVIAVALLGIALFFLNPIRGIGEQEAYKTALTSCCSTYVISGNCGKEVFDFECMVPTTIEDEGFMLIEDLADELGTDYEDYCC